jgi:hypothetical protein
MTAIMAGNPHHTIWAHQPAGVLAGHVRLADMDAIAPQSGRKIGAIIENDRHNVRLGHRGQGGDDGGYDLAIYVEFTGP